MSNGAVVVVDFLEFENYQRKRKVFSQSREDFLDNYARITMVSHKGYKRWQQQIPEHLRVEIIDFWQSADTVYCAHDSELQPNLRSMIGRGEMTDSTILETVYRVITIVLGTQSLNLSHSLSLREIVVADDVAFLPFIDGEKVMSKVWALVDFVKEANSLIEDLDCGLRLASVRLLLEIGEVDRVRNMCFRDLPPQLPLSFDDCILLEMANKAKNPND